MSSCKIKFTGGDNAACNSSTLVLDIILVANFLGSSRTYLLFLNAFGFTKFKFYDLSILTLSFTDIGGGLLFAAHLIFLRKPYRLVRKHCQFFSRISFVGKVSKTWGKKVLSIIRNKWLYFFPLILLNKNYFLVPENHYSIFGCRSCLQKVYGLYQIV